MTWNTLSINSHFFYQSVNHIIAVWALSPAKTHLCLQKWRLCEKKGGPHRRLNLVLSDSCSGNTGLPGAMRSWCKVLPRVNWSSAAAWRSKTAEFAESWQAGSISISLLCAVDQALAQFGHPKSAAFFSSNVVEWAPWAVAVDLVDTDKIFLQSMCVRN